MAESAELARIIEGCKSGDAQAFAQMVDMYAGRCSPAAATVTFIG